MKKLLTYLSLAAIALIFAACDDTSPNEGEDYNNPYLSASTGNARQDSLIAQALEYFVIDHGLNITSIETLQENSSYNVDIIYIEVKDSSNNVYSGVSLALVGDDVKANGKVYDCYGCNGDCTEFAEGCPGDVEVRCHPCTCTLQVKESNGLGFSAGLCTLSNITSLPVMTTYSIEPGICSE